MSFSQYYELVGLDPESAAGGLTAGFRPTPPGWTEVDRLGHVRQRWREVRTANDWEAYYHALWKASLQVVAAECGHTFSRTARALRQKSPFSVRHDW